MPQYSDQTHILPGAWIAIWLVSLFLSILRKSATFLFTNAENLDILLKASAILLVSWSALGVDKLEEPKLDSNRAKKRLSTWNPSRFIINLMKCCFSGWYSSSYFLWLLRLDLINQLKVLWIVSSYNQWGFIWMMVIATRI